MSDDPRPQETVRPKEAGAAAGPETSAEGPDLGPDLGPDGTSPAGARLKGLRTGTAGAVPAAVWEDATAQLAGMLQALATLQGEVPVLASPPDPLHPQAAAADPATESGAAGR